MLKRRFDVPTGCMNRLLSCPLSWLHSCAVSTTTTITTTTSTVDRLKASKHDSTGTKSWQWAWQFSRRAFFLLLEHAPSYLLINLVLVYQGLQLTRKHRLKSKFFISNLVIYCRCMDEKWNKTPESIATWTKDSFLME